MNTTMSYEHFIQVAELRAQVMEAAARFDFRETPKALLFAERCHAGQRRKGPAKLPYIIHPLTMACHALSLGLAEDELIATPLLHDTCEDCHLLPEELPVNAAVQEAVRRLTFFPEPGVPHARARDSYFARIPGNRTAVLTKLLDRCNNLSYMAYGFSREKLLDYIDETERAVIPLLNYAKQHFHRDRDALFLLNYQMYSVMNSIRALLERDL